MKQTFVLTTAVVLLAVAVPLGMIISAQIDKPGARRAPEIKAGDYTLSGPYTHKNLTIFVIHGTDLVSGATPLTLQEALAKRHKRRQRPPG